MSLKKSLLLSSAIILLSSAIILSQFSTALADSRDDKIAAMEAQMRTMMAEIETMKAERAAEKAQMTDSKTVAHIAPAAGNTTPPSNDVTVSMKGVTPKIQKGDVSWQPSGRIHLDFASIDDDKVDHPSGAEIRRARLGMKGKITKDFGYKAEIDLANDNVSAKDVYLNYSGLDKTDIRIGNFKPGYSLEETTSSNDITFIERAAAVNSFTLDRKIGAGIINQGNHHNAQFGVFSSNAKTQSSDDEELSIAGRLAVVPYKTDDSLIHLGASASYRKPDQSDNKFDFDAKAENSLQTADSVSSVLNDGENVVVYGIEAAAASGPLSVQGEYLVADIDNTAGQNPTYKGGYGQVAYTLTGESRSYKKSNGAFSGIKPAKPLDISKGQYGALELAARYSHLDLNDSGLNGGEMDNITLGANWYLNNNMRLMANYIIVDTDDNAVTANDDPKIAIMRSQVKF